MTLQTSVMIEGSLNVQSSKTLCERFAIAVQRQRHEQVSKTYSWSEGYKLFNDREHYLIARWIQRGFVKLPFCFYTDDSDTDEKIAVFKNTDNAVMLISSDSEYCGISFRVWAKEGRRPTLEEVTEFLGLFGVKAIPTSHVGGYFLIEGAEAAIPFDFTIMDDEMTLFPKHRCAASADDASLWFDLDEVVANMGYDERMRHLAGVICTHDLTNLKLDQGASEFITNVYDQRIFNALPTFIQHRIFDKLKKIRLHQVTLRDLKASFYKALNEPMVEE